MHHRLQHKCGDIRMTGITLSVSGHRLEKLEVIKIGVSELDPVAAEEWKVCNLGGILLRMGARLSYHAISLLPYTSVYFSYIEGPNSVRDLCSRQNFQRSCFSPSRFPEKCTHMHKHVILDCLFSGFTSGVRAF